MFGNTGSDIIDILVCKVYTWNVNFVRSPDIRDIFVCKVYTWNVNFARSQLCRVYPLTNFTLL